MAKGAYCPKTCSKCFRDLKKDHNRARHIKRCKGTALFVQNWFEPHESHALLPLAIDIFEHAQNQKAAFFAMIYFNDDIPENQVIRLRNVNKPAGYLEVIENGEWLTVQPITFYERLDFILSQVIDHYRNLLNPPPQIKSDPGISNWQRQAIYSEVIQRKAYQDIAPKTCGNDSSFDTTIDDWKNVEWTEDIKTALREHFEKMTANMRGEVTLRMTDYKVKVLYPRLFKMLYFDAATPQHRLIRLRNIAASNGALEVKVSGIWQERNQKGFFIELYRKLKTVLQDVFDALHEAEELDDPFAVDHYVLTDVEIEDKATHKMLRDKINMVISTGDDEEVPEPKRKATRSSGVLAAAKQRALTLPATGREFHHPTTPNTKKADEAACTTPANEACTSEQAGYSTSTNK